MFSLCQALGAAAVVVIPSHIAKDNNLDLHQATLTALFSGVDDTAHPGVVKASLQSLLLVWRHIDVGLLAERVSEVSVRVRDRLTHDDKQIRGAALDLWTAVLFRTEGELARVTARIILEDSCIFWAGCGAFRCGVRFM